MNRLLILLVVQSVIACKSYVHEEPTSFVYHDQEIDPVNNDPLLAITDEDYLEYGVNVAYVNQQGDTLIPFGDFAYFGTDTLHYFANVILHSNDSTFGRIVGINRSGNILFDAVLFDNGPDYFNDGLIRVSRNRKMGYANYKGEIIIPCQYAYVGWFKNGTAEVTMEAREYYDLDDHLRIESDSWFMIDKSGKRVD